MKVKGKLIFISEDEPVGIMARSLEPDNLSSNITVTNGNTASVTFSSDRISTILSSVDDYLMNAKIAIDLQNANMARPNSIKDTK